MKPNPQQQAIVDHVDGPCLVTAVPGSGKTTSITERTKNLLRLGKAPASMLSITFTNKAADEMRSRIGKAVGEKAAKAMTICTFHSLCARLIRENAAQLGLGHNYTIYDSDDQEKFLKACIYQVEGEDFSIGDQYMHGLMAYIEGTRNACMPAAEARQKYDIDGNQPKVIDRYFAELRRANAIDFTGLLSEANRLFDEHPEVRDRYRHKWEYISVDEVQDTNIAQYRLIQHLGGGHKNVLCVGDIQQSIYAFRNASPENLLRFEKDFGAKILKLETNYRSTPEILRYSQALIEKNTLLMPTVLRTDNLPGDIPKAVFVEHEVQMADEIAREVMRKLSTGIPGNEMAILYRTNYVSRVIEMAMKTYRIKYKVIGGLSFWDRREVKLSIGILKFICNPSDRMSFESVVDACCRGVGPKGLQAIADKALADNTDIMAACKSIVAEGGGLAKNLESIVSVMSQALAPAEALRGLLSKTAFGDKLQKDSTVDNDRKANVDEFARDVEEYMGDGSTLASYLHNISLLTSGDEKESGGEVKLMTMHACKGLEFDVVIVSHACERIIPHRRILEEKDEDVREAQMEEERRLMYVAMTRARKFLRVFCCGVRGVKPRQELMQMSRFIGEAGLPKYKLSSK